MNTNTAEKPPLLRRVDEMIAGIRADNARRAELADASRPNPMVVKLRNGLVLEIGDDGVLAYDPTKPAASNTVGNLVFTKEEGGA